MRRRGLNLSETPNIACNFAPKFIQIFALLLSFECICHHYLIAESKASASKRSTPASIPSFARKRILRVHAHAYFESREYRGQA